MFVTVTFLVLTSIGVKLEQSGIRVSKRELVSLSRFRTIEENHPAVARSKEELQCLAEKSVLFYHRNLSVLDRVFEHLDSGRHGLACILLLPLLETTLRRLFVLENDCPERSLTAEADTLYTTFTEILDPHLPDGGENRTLAALGDDLVTVLLDVLILPDGPRVRDKLGHGEVLFYLFEEDPVVNKEMEVIARHLLNILRTILYQPSSGSSEGGHGYEDYTSLFHPSTFLKTNLVINISELIQFHSVVKQLLNSKGQLLENILDCNDPAEVVYNTMSQKLNDMKIATLYRPREEYEIINLLSRITQSVSLVMKRSVETVGVKTELYEAKLLRSRQRNTYDKMIATLPELLSALFLLVYYLQQTLSTLQTTSEEDIFSILKKKLKSILKICENLRSNVTSQKNKWEEVESLAAELRGLL